MEVHYRWFVKTVLNCWVWINEGNCLTKYATPSAVEENQTPSSLVNRRKDHNLKINYYWKSPCHLHNYLLYISFNSMIRNWNSEYLVILFTHETNSKTDKYIQVIFATYRQLWAPTTCVKRLWEYIIIRW